MENQECYNPNIGGSKLAFPLKYLGQGETLKRFFEQSKKSSVLAFKSLQNENLKCHFKAI